MKPTMSPDDFQRLLFTVCARDTSADPAGWTPENPLWGHCAVASLAAQDRFGGSLLRASLETFPKFAHMRSHYWNRFPNGTQRDFTIAQCGEDRPQGLIAEERTRAYLLSNPDTMDRYKLLSWRLAKALHPGATLFNDDIYRHCYMAAMGSPCQKMRFGCVLMHDGEIVSTKCNATIEPLKALCEQGCIRFSIPSRTESMIGACGHAEELAIWDGVRQGFRLDSCVLYVVGVLMNGSPWLERRAEHSCLRCAVQMHLGGLGGIWLPVQDCWHVISTEQALQDAMPYATGQKTI